MKMNKEVVMVRISDIIPNRFQPRLTFDENALNELALSIKEHGIIQPLELRKLGEDKFEIIAGERRYKASALAGLTKIPAIIRNLDDKESSKVALLENLQRKNLNPIEEARTYQKILEIDQMTQEELAKTMGKSQSAVANKIRLLSLPETIQDALLKEQISERRARSLLNIPDANKQKEMLDKVIATKMSVRSLEEEIKNLYPKEPKEEPLDLGIPSETIASANSFVNSNPLIPTAELPEDKSNYGKVTIAPPIGEETSENRFINYGEIEREEEREADEQMINIPVNSTPIDINSIKENAVDINKNQNGAALDGLLNLGNPTSSIPSTDFITPAEKIVKTDPISDIADKSSDYFKKPDLSSIATPAVINPMDNNLLNMHTITSDKNNLDFNSSQSSMFTIEEAVGKIKELVKEIQNHGVNATIADLKVGTIRGAELYVIVFRGLEAYVPDQSRICILWVISHPELILDYEYFNYQAVFVASKLWFNRLFRRW